MTPIERAVDSAVADLNRVALANPGLADDLKAIGVRLRDAVAPSLSALLEESLGAAAGEPTA